MSVQELSLLHRRYIDLSGRFKAAWTFHQFLQGLQKILMEGDVSRYATDFQGIYSSLKEVSATLNASETDRIRASLDQIDGQLGKMMQALTQEDSRVSASLLRQFFQRVKNYDDNILSQLVRFYLIANDGREWMGEQLDKADFLVTKLGEEAQGPQGPYALRSTPQLHKVLESFWALAVDSPGGHDTAGVLEHLADTRREVEQMGSFDRLMDREVIKRYRSYKHQLGALFFEPSITLSVIQTNLTLKNTVAALYNKEERRIVADYQRIFELEREVPVDTQLDQELTSFHQQVEKFEDSLQRESVKVEQLATLRKQVKSLIPRLTGDLDDSGDSTKPALERELERVAQGVGSQKAAAGVGIRADPWEEDLLSPYFDNLIDALHGANPDASPRAATLTPELFAFRLEAREVVAYRKLSDGVSGDGWERFLLQAAALRNRVQEEVEEIRGILDDSAVNREAPVFDRARQTTRLADLFQHRFSHLIHQAVTDGELEEAQHLQVLRMRLVREASGLWLLVYKPSPT